MIPEPNTIQSFIAFWVTGAALLWFTIVSYRAMKLIREYPRATAEALLFTLTVVLVPTLVGYGVWKVLT